MEGKMEEKQVFTGGTQEKASDGEVELSKGKLEHKKPVFNRIDRLMFGGLLLLSYMGFHFFGLIHTPLFQDNGELWYRRAGILPYTIFFSMLLVFYSIYKKQPEKKVLTWEGLLWILLLNLNGLAFFLFHNKSLYYWNYLLLVLMIVYAAAGALGLLVRGRSSKYFLFDCINIYLLFPLGSFFAGFSALITGFKNRRTVVHILQGFLGILLMMPVLAVVLPLLSSADPAFGDIWFRIRQNFGGFLIRQIYRLTIALLASSYLFGLLYGGLYSKRKNVFTQENLEANARKFHLLPRASAVGALILLEGIYFLFFAVQLRYLTGGLEGRLPQEFTYAAYARRGFFELFGVTLMNLFVVAVMKSILVIKKQEGKINRDPLLRIFFSILYVETLFLIITAMAKMAMYIGAYGLTPLRVTTMTIMLYLLCLFVMLILREFVYFTLVRYGIVLLAVLFTALSMGNIDENCERYNNMRYENGSLKRPEAQDDSYWRR